MRQVVLVVAPAIVGDLADATRRPRAAPSAEVLADITAFLTGRPLPVSAYPRQAAPPGYAGPR